MNWRRKLSAVVALAVAVLPLLPAEHVHEALDIDGHAHFYAHRHVQNHHAKASERPTSTFEDHDSALNIDTFVAPPAQHFVPILLMTRFSLIDSLVITEVLTRTPLTHPIHGPPIQVHTLRAPPPSALL